MVHQQQTAVLTVALSEVEQRLRDVEAWTAFLPGVQQIRKTSHERYLFRLAGRGHPREVPVVVRYHPREHRISWHALSGPGFDGRLRLAPMDCGWTRVELAANSSPSRLIEQLTEMVKPSGSGPVIDLDRLQDHLTVRTGNDRGLG